MSLTRAIAGNTVTQVAGRFIGTILGLLTVGIMTRSLGRAGYGEFTTVTTFLQFFGILVDFGLSITLVRMIAAPNEDEGRIISNVLTLRLVSAAVFFGLAPLVALLFPYAPDIKTGVAIAALSFLAISLTQVLVGVFQKHLAVHRAAIAEVAGRAVLLAGAAASSMLAIGVLPFIIALVAANVVQFSVCFAFARRLAPIRLAFDFPLWKRIVRESWPIGVSIAFNLIYLKGDVVILSLTRPQAEVGLYGAAYKVLDVITVVPMIFMGLMLPVLAASWAAANRDDFNRKLGRAFDFLSMLAFPLALGTPLVGRDLMRLVAGNDFAASGDLLAILMIAGAAVCWSAAFGHAIVAQGLQKKMIAAYAADAALSLVLYLIFIPRYGAVGAAWVTVFSELFIVIIAAATAIRAAGRPLNLRAFWRIAVAALVMDGAILAIPTAHVLVRLAVAIVVYVALLFVFDVVDRETLEKVMKQKTI